jgi:peptide/nickel transport system ATP-binding protein
MAKVVNSILRIENLTVSYVVDGESQDAVRDLYLQINPGQTYGLVGESGSGKSSLTLAIMRYLSRNGSVKSGRIFLGKQDLAQLRGEELRQVWQKRISFVPQNPFGALNPSMRLGDQVAEAIHKNDGSSHVETYRRVIELFKHVKLADASSVAARYPHQVSGGMHQRVLLAMALGHQPDLLVLDEPTTSLDVTTQAAVLDLIRELSIERDTATLYVTHNLGVVAGLTDRVAVLYASELVEDAPTDQLFAQPLHPYTRGLLDSVPRLAQYKDEKPLQGIVGRIPTLDELPSACLFAPRCPLTQDICWEERPLLEEAAPGRMVRCHRWPEILAGKVSPSRNAMQPINVQDYAPKPLISVDELEVRYPLRRSLGDLFAVAPTKEIRAVDGVSLNAATRQTLGIVGESGSGKTSLARAIVGLIAPQRGQIEFNGISLPPSLVFRSPDLLARIQMMFQNTAEALNPNIKIGETLERPLRKLLGLNAQEASQRVSQLLELVKLPPEFARRLPGQLSGGEKQRVALARAFASNPDVLLADEPVSSLDVSVQAAILNLLSQLQLKHNTAVLFISHNIAVVTYLADQIAVMYLGKVMQTSSSKTIFDPPYHPYTEALLSAVPPPDPRTHQEKIRLEGEIPSAIDRPTGCPFHTRCPRFLGEICVEETPPWQEGEDGKRIFCHIGLDELEAQQPTVLRFQESG